MSARFLDLVGVVRESRVEGRAGNPTISDVEHNSRAVQAGHLFCCVKGSVADGHLHAPDAIAAGAVAVLAERPLSLGVPEIIVPSVRAAMGPIAARVHGDPSAALDVVGVTGTNGKTTTVHLLAAIAAAAGRPCAQIGTLTGVRTTPEAPELQRRLAAARADGAEIVAMEVSSHALDQHRVDGTRFRVAGFTNLGVDHLDHHGSIEAYFAAKARLFESGFSDRAVIDVGTPHGQLLADTVEIPAVRIEPDVEILELGPALSRFRWRDHTVELPLGGTFNIANARLAAEIAVILGVDEGVIVDGLRTAAPVPGRFESVDEGQEFGVVVDYAHTPDGLEAVLTAARQVTDRSLTVVFGAGGDRDRTKRPRMGAVAEANADRVVVTSDNPRSEEPDEIIAAIVDGMVRRPALVEADRRTAIRHAIAGAREGDVVVIAGKGHESTQAIGDAEVDFDDRVVARAELRRLQERTP